MEEIIMSKAKKKNRVLGDFKRSLPFLFLALPGFITLVVFRLVPLFGLVLPFKDYKPAKGFFGSEWVGFRNS